MAETLPPTVAGTANRALESLHSMIYFAPEADEEYPAVGLRPGRMGYFASRSAAMGAVTPAVTAATFYNFNPDKIAQYLPRAWTLATPEQVLAARLRVADQALRRLLGDAIDSTDVAELADLTRDASAGLSPVARPLYAAHAQLPWPDVPHLALWHGCTLLREYRGDGHLAALLLGGLGGIEALILHTATGRGFLEAAAKASRGWSDEQWAAGVDALRSRGLLDADAALTPAGIDLRTSVEQHTDQVSLVPWETLGAQRTERLVQLGKTLTRRVVAAGAFPPGVFATGSDRAPKS